MIALELVVEMICFPLGFPRGTPQIPGTAETSCAPNSNMIQATIYWFACDAHARVCLKMRPHSVRSRRADNCHW